MPFCIRAPAATLLTGLLVASVGFAQSIEDQRDATLMIIETAERICDVSETEGAGSSTNMAGEADASVAFLSKRLLELGIEGAANLQESEYRNVLREQLADELKDARQCRRQVFDQMFATVFGEPARSVLKEQTDEVLSGSVLPHELEVIAGGARFIMKPNESVALGVAGRMFTVNEVKQNLNLGPLVYYNWVDLASGDSVVGHYARQAQPIRVGDCNVVPYRIDVDGQSASFLNACAE